MFLLYNQIALQIVINHNILLRNSGNCGKSIENNPINSPSIPTKKRLLDFEIL